MAKKEREKKEGKDPGEKVSSAIGGILGGLTELVERLSELADKGEEISRSGTLQFRNSGRKDLKGVYGFSFKTGIGGKDVKVEPFGNVRKDKTTGRSVVHEIHEPIVDVFDEGDHVLIVAEMPGVGAEDVHVDLKQDIMILSADAEGKKYRKELLLPGEFQKEQMSITTKNGIVKIKCIK